MENNIHKNEGISNFEMNADSQGMSIEEILSIVSSPEDQKTRKKALEEDQKTWEKALAEGEKAGRPIQTSLTQGYESIDKTKPAYVLVKAKSFLGQQIRQKYYNKKDKYWKSEEWEGWYSPGSEPKEGKWSISGKLIGPKYYAYKISRFRGQYESNKVVACAIVKYFDGTAEHDALLADVPKEWPTYHERRRRYTQARISALCCLALVPCSWLTAGFVFWMAFMALGDRPTSRFITVCCLIVALIASVICLLLVPIFFAIGRYWRNKAIEISAKIENWE